MSETQGRVLIVDSDESMRVGSQKTLELGGFSSAAVATGTQALERIQQESFDAALLDLRIAGSSGMEVLKKLKVDSPNTAVIIMTSQPTIDSAMKAIKLGAYDYLPEAI